MIDVEIIPFEPEHLELLSVREEEKDIRAHKDFMKWAEINHQPGLAYSGFFEGRMLGCAGIRMLWPGVGEGWAQFSPEIINFGKEAYHYVGIYLKKLIEDNDLHRVQGTVDAEFMIAHKYIQNLGFQIEGKMLKYGPTGRDHYLYAWTKE